MSVIDFESHSRRVQARRAGALAHSNLALSHFAAGALSAQEAVQTATLSLMAAAGLPATIRTVTQQWPAELGVDMCALALVAHDEAFRAGPGGIQRLPARRVRAWAEGGHGVHVRAVEGAAHLFGPAGDHVRTLGIAPFALPHSLALGVFAIGSASATPPDAMDGGGILDFLAAALSRKLAACLMQAP